MRVWLVVCANSRKEGKRPSSVYAAQAFEELDEGVSMCAQRVD